MKIDREKIIKIVEGCGGIGAFTEAMKKLKIPFQIADYIEIDKKAVNSFNAMNDTNFETQDIRTYNKELKDIDIYCFGFPCTSISTLGKQEGCDEESGTPSSMLWDNLRVIDKNKPKIVVFENVASILSKRHSHNFYKYLSKMEALGYKNKWKVINACDYGQPQSRRRVFVVSTLKDEQFEFPKPIQLEKTLYDLLDEDYDASQVVLNEKELKMIKDFGARYSFGGSIVKENIYPTITASYGKVSGNSGKIKCKDGYRILTPREAWKFMGFSEEAFEKASQVNSNKQLYKQAGNSIVVDVLVAILKELFNIKNIESK